MPFSLNEYYGKATASFGLQILLGLQRVHARWKAVAFTFSSKATIFSSTKTYDAAHLPNESSISKRDLRLEPSLLFFSQIEFQFHKAA